KSKFYRFDKEGNRWKERTDGTVKFPKNKVTSRGAITKRMTAIEEMAGMDVLCIDKTGTLTLNKLTVDKNLIEVFADGINQDMVVLMAARASRLENQDAIDCAIVSTLADPKELAITKETGRCLGMGSNMYPSSSLLGESKDNFASVPVDDLIEDADGFAGVFPEHKYEIVKRLQARKHICGMTDICCIYTIRIVVGFMLLTCIWEFNFPPFMVLVIAILNDGEMKQLMCFLRSIYDLARLEDEVDFLTAQSEQDRQKRNNVKFWHVFRSKEIRLAFLVGGGLLANKRHKAKGCCGWTSTGLKLSTRLWSMATSHKISRNWLQNRIDPICSSMDHLVLARKL
ncbi:hypothetical protein S245_035249, partial [Arachis hypogaea]